MEIVALGRKPLGLPGVFDVSFDLAAPDTPSLPAGTRALIHLAADTAGTGMPPGAEEAALRALRAALPADAPLLFASSQSAARDAPSAYGRAKWELEQVALAIGATPVRIALVVGGEERGLFGRLCATLRRLPVRPVLLPQPLTQPLHVDDVAEALLRAALSPQCGVLALAGPPMPFGTLLARIARARAGRAAPPVPVPLPLLLAMLRLGERLTGRVLGAAQLEGLSRTRALPNDGLRRLGMAPRPPLGTRGLCRHALLHEGTLLMRHLAGTSVPPLLARRYAAILLQHSELPILRGGVPGPLARLAIWVLDGPRPRPALLGARLLLALRVLEASPRTARVFLGPAEAPDRPVAALAGLAVSAMTEATRRLVHLLLAAPLRRVLDA